MTANISRTTGNKIAGLIGWLLICYATSFIGAIVSPGIASPEWYQALAKPSWTPPGWIFGPVWTTLYTLMGLAAWWIWKDFGWMEAAAGLRLFIIQLVFNAAWSWIFFRWHLLGWAAIEIIVLWALILATLRSFWRHNRWAGALLIPYLLWVSFAAALTFSIWQLNG